MLRSLIVAAICIANLVHSKTVDLPVLHNSCTKKSENYGECLISTFQKSWPRIVKGIPEYNIPPLDPWVIENMSGHIQFGPFRGQTQMSNSTIYGIPGLKFLSMDPKIENNHLHLELEVFEPKVFFETDYDMKDGLSELVIQMKGHMNMSITDMKTLLVVDGPIVNDRWKIETINISPDIGDMKFWASDMFNGNKEITELLVAFINANWRLLYTLDLPMIVLFANLFLKDFANNISAEIPISQIFPQ